MMQNLTKFCGRVICKLQELGMIAEPSAQSHDPPACVWGFIEHNEDLLRGHEYHV